MSRAFPGLSLLLSLCLAGCGDDGAGDASLVRDLSFVFHDHPLSSIDLVGTADLAVAADLAAPAPDQSAPPDLVSAGDAPVSSEITAVVEKEQAWQDCMPIVAPDPLHFGADVIFTNAGMAPSAMIHIAGGAALDANGKVLARFGLAPVKDFTVAAGGKMTVQVNKTANSLQPANGCNSVPCRATVSWGVDWSLGGGQVRTAVSTSGPMTCVF